jgi:hypothetical protein
MKDKIIEVLKRSSYPMRARYIARQLGVDRTTINRILYSNLNNPFIKNDNFEWTVRGYTPEANNTNLSSQNLTFEWSRLTNYVTKMYNENPDLFVLEVFNYSMADDLKRLIAELEVYVMHLLLHIQNNAYQQYIEISDVHKLLIMLKPSLHFDYLNNEFTIKYLMKRFQSEDNYIQTLIKSFVKYDEIHNSLESLELIKRLELIGLCIYHFQKNQPSVINELNNVIQYLRNYAHSNKNFNEAKYVYEVNCVICDESILLTDAVTDSQGNHYCEDCYDELTADEDDEFEMDDEDDSSDPEVDFEKDEIIEDCTTCFYKKNGSCAKAHLNIVCEKYKYKG